MEPPFLQSIHYDTVPGVSSLTFPVLEENDCLQHLFKACRLTGCTELVFGNRNRL